VFSILGILNYVHCCVFEIPSSDAKSEIDIGLGIGKENNPFFRKVLANRDIGVSCSTGNCVVESILLNYGDQVMVFDVCGESLQS